MSAEPTPLPPAADEVRAEVRAVIGDAGSRPATLAPEDDVLLAEISLVIQKRGLATPAVLWLESVRPLSFVGAQAMHFLTPFVQMLLPASRFERLAGILEERAHLERLVHLIEIAAGAPPTDGEALS